MATKTAFRGTISTWWFTSFAWSRTSSVPFSGYVNTEGDRESRSVMNPVTMLRTHAWKVWLYYSLYHRWHFTLIYCRFLALSGPAFMPSSMWCSPDSPRNVWHRLLCMLTPCTRLWLAHVLVIVWQLCGYHLASFDSAILMNRECAIHLCKMYQIICCGVEGDVWSYSMIFELTFLNTEFSYLY